jgi:hypothetical protein
MMKIAVIRPMTAKTVSAIFRIDTTVWMLSSAASVASLLVRTS